MKSIAIYAFDDKAKYKVIDSTFARFEMSLREAQNADGRGMRYIDDGMQKAFCKYLGFTSRNKVSGNVIEAVANLEAKHLQEVKKLLSKPNYEKVYEKFNKVLVKLKSQITAAEKVAGAGGKAQINAAAITCNELLNTISSYVDDVSSDTCVVSLRQKLDKLIAKNRALYDSKSYSLDAAKGAMYGVSCARVDVNAQSGGIINNIDDAINQAVRNAERNANEALDEFRDLIKSLLQGCSSVGFMLSGDDNFSNAKSERNVIIGDLKNEDILNFGMKERIMFYTK